MTTSSPGKIRPEKWKEQCLLLHNHQNDSLTAHSLWMHHPGGSGLRSHLEDFQVWSLVSAAGVPWCSKNPYCNCNAEAHDLSQGFWAPSSKNRKQWGSGSPVATSLGLEESCCGVFHLPAPACSLTAQTSTHHLVSPGCRACSWCALTDHLYSMN